MKWSWTTICVFALALLCMAQSLPPVQTIQPNTIPCNALASTGAVTQCKPATNYGCSSNQTGNIFLQTDGKRTSIQFQNTGAIPEVLTFGDTPVGNNGFIVQPGNSYLWSNMSQGNTPGTVATTTVGVISVGTSSCTFIYTD